MHKLESDNAELHKAVIDLKARSMRDNLLFYNIEEWEHENTTAIIHDILEEKMGMVNAKEAVKIDRSHRLGKKRNVGNLSKPRPIRVLLLSSTITKIESSLDLTRENSKAHELAFPSSSPQKLKK